MEDLNKNELTPTESFGDFLRRHREASGKSIENISHITRVGKQYLVAFEEGNHSTLPARPFARGFLKAYANEIGLDVGATLSRYEDFCASISSTSKEARALEPIRIETVSSKRQASKRRFWSLCMGTVLTIGIVTFLWQARSNSNMIDSINKSVVETKPLTSSEVNSNSGQGVAPVTPSVLRVLALKAGVLSVRIDDNAAQAMKMKKGDAKLLNIYREVEMRSTDKSAFRYEFDGKPLEISGPVIKLFNRHLFKKN